MSTTAQYHIQPVPFTGVKITDQFWLPRLETNRTVTVHYDLKKCEETGRISNFAKAGGLTRGEHEGIFFNDSDLFKVIEGAAYTLMQQPDAKLAAYLDKIIGQIAAAQEPDGYLYTARTIAERNKTPDRLQTDREGTTRYSNLRVSHELYNVGHLYEAAVAHFQATGKRNLLDVAIKSADHVERLFGPSKLRAVPGHQEIEIGLVKLYQVTNNERYLKLAKFFLDERGQADGHTLYGAYAQDHCPVTEQSEAVGHAVRAGYMYAGMADVASLTGEQSYIKAIGRIWENVVSKKLYITGGMGARHEGEAFGDEYELPNATAYNETCAAIANIYWNQRMFQLHGDARYIDVLERSLYNGFLAGIAFSGDSFFYVNPLEFDGTYRFNRDDSLVRMPWFGCSCCPTNVVRLFPALGSYIYGHNDDQLYVNLFMSSKAETEVAAVPVTLTQLTKYPWDGTIKLKIDPAKATRFTLNIRIPGWTQGKPVPSGLYRYIENEEKSVIIKINREEIEVKPVKGYVRITRRWIKSDTVEITLPMPVQRVLSHSKVAINKGKVAIERGPLVYCLEGLDNGGKALNQTLSDKARFGTKWTSDLLQGVNVIRARQGKQELVFVPYYAWAHRGIGEMAVWLERGQ